MQNGTAAAEQPMLQYKCLHETLLRRAEFQTTPVYTGSRPQTSPWSDSLVPVAWYQPVSLWQGDCTPQRCCKAVGSCTSSDVCVDTITKGLFYASASESEADPKIVLAQIVADSVSVGPRFVFHRKLSVLRSWLTFPEQVLDYGA